MLKLLSTEGICPGGLRRRTACSLHQGAPARSRASLPQGSGAGEKESALRPCRTTHISFRELKQTLGSYLWRTGVHAPLDAMPPAPLAIYFRHLRAVQLEANTSVVVSSLSMSWRNPGHLQLSKPGLHQRVRHLASTVSL